MSKLIFFRVIPEIFSPIINLNNNDVFLLRPTGAADDAQPAPVAKKVFAFDFAFIYFKVLKCFRYRF